MFNTKATVAKTMQSLIVTDSFRPRAKRNKIMQKIKFNLILLFHRLDYVFMSSSVEFIFT